MSAALFLVDPPLLEAARPGGVVSLTGAEGHHAADVLRVRSGETVAVSDGQGRRVDGEVARVSAGVVSVSVRACTVVPAPSPRLVVAQPPMKGGRDTDAVAAMTEVGVDEVIGWSAGRAVARWGSGTAARWSSTARAATKQSRRAWLPLVSGPLTTEALAARLAGAALAVVLDEGADEPLTGVLGDGVPGNGVPGDRVLGDRVLGDDARPDGEVVLVVGPEGGITPEELAVFRSAGAKVCRLGDTVLRAGTAGVAGSSVVLAATRWR